MIKVKLEVKSTINPVHSLVGRSFKLKDTPGSIYPYKIKELVRPGEFTITASDQFIGTYKVAEVLKFISEGSWQLAELVTLD